MKPVKARITKGLEVGSKLEAADNSGASIVKIASVKGGKAVKGRRQGAGVGDIVIVSVKKGDRTMRKQLFPAVIIRQRRPYRRMDGTRIKFEDNACVVLKDEEGDPEGTIVKGPVAREVVERYPKIGKISSIVV